MREVDEDVIIDRYCKRENVRSIAKAFGISPQTIYNILTRRNLARASNIIKDLLPKLIEMCAAGAPVAVAAKYLGMSESTATRALRKHRCGGDSLFVRRGRPSTTRVASVARVINGAPLHGTPFPFPEMLSGDKIRYEFDRLHKHACHLDGDEIRPRSPIGLRICYPFFPNRYKARSGRLMSAFEAWHIETDLEKAIQLQIKYNAPTTPDRVLRAVSLRCRTPTIFRPAVAKFICGRYCPTGGRVYDPCAGYGGRLLGAVAAGVRYIGTDVEPETIEGNRRLANALGADVDLRVVPAEVFEPPEVDLVFTSPPYFDRERYSTNIEQSWRRYATVDAWVDGFLRPVVERAFGALVAGGHLVLNITDLKKNGRTIPLVSLTTQTALAAGFEHVETLRMPLAAINRADPSEPVLVFRKL